MIEKYIVSPVESTSLVKLDCRIVHVGKESGWLVGTLVPNFEFVY